jgi:hypothetical protein
VSSFDTWPIVINFSTSEEKTMTTTNAVDQAMTGHVTAGYVRALVAANWENDTPDQVMHVLRQHEGKAFTVGKPSQGVKH